MAAVVVIAGVWYLSTPAIPPVHLPEDADPALLAEVSRAHWAIRRWPWSDSAWGHMAMLLQAHGQDSDAAAFYTQAERLNPNEPRWPYLHAAVVEGVDGPLAMDLLRRSTELSRSQKAASDRPLVRLADLLLENAHLEEAQQAYTQLLQRRPDHPRAHLGLARLALRRGQAPKALPHLQACLNSPEVRREAHLVLAEVHQRCGKPQDAAHAARQADKLPRDVPAPDPWLEEVQMMLTGRTGTMHRLAELQGQGRLREAQALQARTAQKEYPDIGLLEAGRDFLRQGRWSEGEAALRKSLQLNPAELDGHYLLGRALFEQNRFAEAAQSFQRATQIDSKYGPAYREWGRCAAALGEQGEALRRLREAIKYVPHDAAAHRELGALLAAQGDRDGALLHLSQAVQLNPADSPAQVLFKEVKSRHR